MKNEKTIALLWLAIGVIAGALGAHALKKVVTSEALESFKTGVLYQLLAGTWVLIISQMKRKSSGYLSSSTLIFAGSILFSLSIYGLVLFPLIGLTVKILGPITPIGGLLMITGLIKAAFEQKQVD